ncbi:MAG: GPW/gp25 family protein [Calothrix sp. SM1_7_51]|nr:GPW/gp25 family protein [Calothrix sp. SM1_7_51]
MEIAYPFRIDGRGRVADAIDNEHIRQMIEQVLFTNPGERVNRPDFGCGLMQLIFAPNSTELAAAVEFIVKGALEQWLGDVIQVETLNVETVESKLEVTIQFVVRRTQQRQIGLFSREV